MLFAPDMTHEFDMVTRHHDFTVDDLRTVTLASVDSAFCDDATKTALRSRLEEGFAAS
jgi:adenosine deaminase